MGPTTSAFTFHRVTRSLSSLRRFAGLTVECAFDSIRRGKVDVATYYCKLLYFLPFSPRSLEKVLIFGLIKACCGYVKKDINYYILKVNEISVDPDDESSIRASFESLIDLGMAVPTGGDAISLRPEVVNEMVRIIAPYIAEVTSPADIEIESASIPYKIVSGISALYVMHKGNRLPRCYSVLTGLVSPVVRITASGDAVTKSTIDLDEWSEAKKRISRIKTLRDSFQIEYFKAIGLMVENKILVRTYPMEISGYFIENIIKPAYQHYYNLVRMRRRGRGYELG